MTQETKFTWKNAIKLGAIGGVLVLYVSLVGMVQAFDGRFIISETLTLGQLLLFLPPLIVGYISATRTGAQRRISGILFGAVAGIVTGAMLAALLLLGNAINLRAMFINASPELWEILMFGQDTLATATAVLVIGAGLIGVLGAIVSLLPASIRNAVIIGASTVVIMGILQELLKITFGTREWYAPIDDFLYEQKGLSWAGAAVTFLLGAAFSLWRTYLASRPKKTVVKTRSREQQRYVQIGSFVLGAVLLLILPQFLGPYPSEILNTVGIYVIMGLGLNIVVGYAGLLDLGYVAFFAIGAYVVGVLTTTGSLATVMWSWWLALPFAILVSLLAGVLLGIPVLKMRGDYLAIVTLGFGEIIRVLAVSNWLKPYIGGAQGILQIPKPQIGDFVFDSPERIFYLVAIGIGVVAFVAWRMRDARVGRAWKALREDEDVAEAMGINLVNTKLLAFATGAAFAGLSGAIFATKLGSIFPQSFNLIVSINVLSLIIVGGIGSIPGVLVGAFMLVGLPELLREFADYRMLMYGALLVIMMLVRPEGFIPEKTHKAELHEDSDFDPEIEPEAPARMAT
ncbi:MAG: leucine/isoleucine/valine transporter permease subunit [Chloroflexi bacterium]|nr:leucine/isoleucine/valine transporter permease subunit [Chloroflexota bacterium]